MATRAACLSADHVQALNMIDLLLYRSHLFGSHRRSKTEQCIYSPQARGDLEAEQRALRKLAMRALFDEGALKMDVASFPVDEEVVKLQGAVSKGMSEALNNRALNVTVKRDKPAA